MGPEYTELSDTDYIHLERFLDVTKANLFFAKGVILVEGWSEEILIPSLARKLKSQRIISKDFTEAGVSIVNIGNIGFLHYSRIFLRKDEENILQIPVSVIKDVDVRAYKRIRAKNTEGKLIIDSQGEPIYTYVKIDESEVETETQPKIEEITEELKRQKVNVFVAPFWTFEYSLFKSKSLSEVFCEVFKKVHPHVDEEKYEEELGKKLLNKGLKKTEIAYELAQKIETTSELELSETDAAIKYLIDAIKYVCND
jgi:putative ATP-dependent endonuclease of OLD family